MSKFEDRHPGVQYPLQPRGARHAQLQQLPDALHVSLPRTSPTFTLLVLIHQTPGFIHLKTVNTHDFIGKSVQNVRLSLALVVGQRYKFTLFYLTLVLTLLMVLFQILHV